MFAKDCGHISALCFGSVPPVAGFWQNVASELTTFVSGTVAATIPVLLLNDTSSLQISKCQKRIVLAGLTAAKKMVAVRWKPLHSLTIKQWLLTFLDIVYTELSTARINSLFPRNIVIGTVHF